jgi:hypothetical protein
LAADGRCAVVTTAWREAAVFLVACFLLANTACLEALAETALPDEGVLAVLCALTVASDSTLPSAAINIQPEPNSFIR